MDFTQLRLEFNRHLLEAIGGQILDTSIFSWNGGFTKWALGICLAIAFFQSVLKSEKSMLVEWTKILLSAWFCMAILGGVDATSVPVFSQMNNRLPPSYKVIAKYSSPTLERIVFNWMAWKFDQLGEALMSQGEGKLSLNEEIQNLNNLQEKLMFAIGNCDPSNSQCLKDYLTAQDPSAKKEADEKKDPAKKDEGFWSGAVPGVGAIASAIGAVVNFFSKLSNPAFLLFPVLMWILDIVRAFINFFVLLTFGITAAMGLFFTKILCVLMVIPSYRDRVIGMFKFTLSASMYGFAMNLLLWISIVITKALNEATATIIIQRISTSTNIAKFSAEIGTLMISNFLTSFVIMLMQIVAMTKVPKFTEKLMNLSLQEIVNIGETLFQAGLGMAKVAAGMAVGVGGLALGAAGGAASGVMAKSSAARDLGNSMSGKFRGMMGWNESGSPSDFGGAGGGGSSVPQGGFSGPKGGGSRGGGSDLTNVAMGEANLKASTSRRPDTLLKAEDDMTPEEKLENEKKKAEAADKLNQNEAGNRIAKLGSIGNDVPDSDRALTATEERSKREAKMKAGFKTFKAWGGAAGGTLLNMAFDGAQAGSGAGGDGLSTVKGVMNTMGTNSGKMSEWANKKADKYTQKGISQVYNETDLAERSENAESVYRSAVVGGKTDMNEADSSMLDNNLEAINSGKASNEQMRQVLESQNTKKLSNEQKNSISQARRTSKNFGSMMNDQEDSNKDFMKNLSEEYRTSGGKLSNETVSQLAAKTDAGLMDYDQVSKQSVWNGSGASKFTTLGQALGNSSKDDISAALKPMTDKLAAGEALSIPEQQQARRMYDNNQEALVGQDNLLDGFDQTLGGSVDTSGMRKSREDSTKEVEAVLQAMKKAGNGLSATVYGGASRKGNSMTSPVELSMETQSKYGRTTKTGGIDGFYMGDKAVTNSADFKKLDAAHQKRFNDMYEHLKQAVEDKETNNMVKERMANLRLDSDNLVQMVEQMRKIKGDD